MNEYIKGAPPCPECGEKNRIFYMKMGPSHAVSCEACGFTLGPFSRVASAAQKWAEASREAEERRRKEEKEEREAGEIFRPAADQIQAGRMPHVMLPIEQLMNHPKNVRKEYTDIEELADSIRTRGVMQNLTVVPAPGHEESCDLYYVVIGNRRLQAAKRAGVQLLPCMIAFDMPEREQISIMVTENMQRTDLTIIEQAESFQMMLDLGETIQTIHEKTGLSESTVRHRLKLSELGVENIRRRQENEADGEKKCFQLSIKDYEYLEKVKSVKERREILDKAESPGNLRWMVDDHVRRAKRENILVRFRGIMQSMGIRFDKDGSPWHKDFVKVKEYSLEIEDSIPDEIILPEKYIGEEEKMMWCTLYDKVYIMAPIKKERKKKSAAEIEAEAREKNKKKISGALKAMREETRLFVIGICDDKYGRPEDAQIMERLLWDLLVRPGNAGTFSGDIRTLAGVYHGAAPWGMSPEKYEAVSDKAMWKQMLLAVFSRYGEYMYSSVVGYRGEYRKENAEDLIALNRILKKFGFSWSEDYYEQIMDGTYELYWKGETQP